MTKNVLIVTTSLDCGGITSFLISLANELVNIGYNVKLAYTSDESRYLEDLQQCIQRVQYRRIKKMTRLRMAVSTGKLLDVMKIKFRKHDKPSPTKSIQRLAHEEAKRNHELIGIKYDIAISSAEFFCNAM